MMLGLVIGVVVITIGAYAFWMAGELGLAPRWRIPRMREISRRDSASDGAVRQHGGP